MRKKYTSMYLKIDADLFKKVALKKALCKKKTYEIMEEALNLYFKQNPINKQELENIGNMLMEKKFLKNTL